MRRYKNGKTVFDADDMAALSPDRDPSVPLTEGQKAFLLAVVGGVGVFVQVPVEEARRG